MQTFNQIILYLFNPTPGREFTYYIFIGIFTALLFGIGVYIIVHIKQNKKDKSFKKLFKNYPSKLFFLGILLITYLFFRFYYVTFFSMRFLLFLLLAISIFVLYSMVNTYIKKYPKDKQARSNRLEQNKWLPKNEKRKRK